MTTPELLDRLKAKVLEQFVRDQEEFIRCHGRDAHRNSLIDSRIAEVRAATRIGDVLQVMISIYEATAYDDDAPAFRRLPHSAEHEKVYLFILRELGAKDLRLEDVQLHAKESRVGSCDHHLRAGVGFAFDD